MQFSLEVDNSLHLQPNEMSHDMFN